MLHCLWGLHHFFVCNIRSVSVTINFIHPQSAADYAHALGEVVHIVYCLLLRKKNVLLLVEQWEEYMAPNHSKFTAIKESLRSDSSPWENRELLFEDGIQAGLQEVSWTLRELCVVDSCCEVCDRPRVELFLHSYIGWWRRWCLYATVWHVASWTPGEKLDDRRRDGGLHVRISIVCARVEAARADFN